MFSHKSQSWSQIPIDMKMPQLQTSNSHVAKCEDSVQTYLSKEHCKTGFVDNNNENSWAKHSSWKTGKEL